MEILGSKEKAKSTVKDCGIAIRKSAKGTGFNIAFGADVSKNFLTKSVKIGKDEAKLYFVVVPRGNGYNITENKQKNGISRAYLQINCKEVNSVLENYQGNHELLMDEHGFFITPTIPIPENTTHTDEVEKLKKIINEKDAIISRQAHIIYKTIDTIGVYTNNIAELCNFCEEELKNDK